MRSHDIGSMGQRFAVQRLTASDDGYGQAVETWATIATRWGSIESAQQRERVVAEQLRGVATHVITMRGRIDLKTADRLVFNGRVFSVIQAIDPDGQDWSRDVVCQEVTSP